MSSETGSECEMLRQNTMQVPGGKNKNQIKSASENGCGRRGVAESEKPKQRKTGSSRQLTENYDIMRDRKQTSTAEMADENSGLTAAVCSVKDVAND